jgi:hypothetical protein
MRTRQCVCVCVFAVPAASRLGATSRDHSAVDSAQCRYYRYMPSHMCAPFVPVRDTGDTGTVRHRRYRHTFSDVYLLCLMCWYRLCRCVRLMCRYLSCRVPCVSAAYVLYIKHANIACASYVIYVCECVCVSVSECVCGYIDDI